MLLARRDAAFAWGRFALVGGVIALLTLLVSLLSGLTAGLGSQSTSALEDAGKNGVTRVLTSGENLGLSTVTADQAKAAEADASRDGKQALPLTVGMARLERKGAPSTETPHQAAVFAAPRTSSWAASVPEQGLALPASLAGELGVKSGDTVLVNGTELKVSKTDAPDTSYAHAPVVGLPEAKAREVLHTQNANALLTDSDSLSVDGLTSRTVKDSFNAIPGYRSEHGSLLMIQVILYVIAGLVVAAFLTIWTLQRTRDLSLLRALGASEGFLFRDGIAQAAIVLIGGTLVGGLAGWGLGALAASAVPFALTPQALALPAVLVLAVGFLGSLGAVSRVRTVNPLAALGGNA